MNAERPVSAAARQLEEVAAVIGQPNLLALCKALGGTRIYVPARIGHNNPIAAVIGLKASALLAEHYHGLWLDLPKAHTRRARAIEYAESGEMTIAEAALATDYTERRIYQLLEERRRARGEDSTQLDLFAKP